MADIISGTYEFVGGVVRMVRDAGLTLADVNALRRAAEQARRTHQPAEDFASENPAAAPIINLIVQQKPERDWLMILIVVLGIIIPYLQNASYHAEDAEPQRAASAPTTLVISDSEVQTIEKDLVTKLRTDELLRSAPRNGVKPRATKAAPKRGGSQHRRKHQHGRSR